MSPEYRPAPTRRRRSSTRRGELPIRSLVWSIPRSETAGARGEKGRAVDLTANSGTMFTVRITLARGAWLDHDPAWLSEDDADAALTALRGELEWEQREIVLFGRGILQPRLIAWAGEVGYRYSGQTLEPRAFTPAARRLLELLDLEPGARVARIVQKGDRGRLRRDVVQQLEPFGLERKGHPADTCHIAARSIQAGDEAVFDRVAPIRKDDRHRRGYDLGCKRCRIIPDDHGYRPVDQIGH